jgi:flavin-dependent dehydrogenase
MQITFIGGGLAGLTSALALAKAGKEITIVEKKQYPFHKVCGEYISNEVLPYLTRLGADPLVLNPARITRMMVSDTRGRKAEGKLDLGGFGISRYTFDNYLYNKCREVGVNFITGTQVNEVFYQDNAFRLSLSNGDCITSDIAAGSYGKRSKIDRQLGRPFFQKESPYVGVKYHIRTDFPNDLIALHNFEQGYCGISRIEDGKYCLCYLTTRENLRRYGNIPEMEESILWKNPLLKHIFQNAEYLYDRPEVINEISFATKEPVNNHILMAGDAAGMIAPLCGNGMAMAIHSGKILAEEILNYTGGHQNREQMEKQYATRWKNLFAGRLRTGRAIQHLFGKPFVSTFAISACRTLPFVLQGIIRRTHGEAF